MRLRRTAAAGALAISVLASGCQLVDLYRLPAATAGKKCSKVGDFAADWFNVLQCKENRRWKIVTSVQQAEQWLVDLERAQNPLSMTAVIDSASAMNGPWIRVSGWVKSSGPSFDYWPYAVLKVNGQLEASRAANADLSTSPAAAPKLTGSSSLDEGPIRTDLPADAWAFDVMVNATAPTNEVCIASYIYQEVTDDTELDGREACVTVVTPKYTSRSQPALLIDTVTTGPSQLTIDGWGLPADQYPSAGTPLPQLSLELYERNTDKELGPFSPIPLMIARPDVAAAIPGLSTTILGFSYTVSLAPGEWSLCLSRSNTGRIANSSIDNRAFDCRDVTVPA